MFKLKKEVSIGWLCKSLGLTFKGEEGLSLIHVCSKDELQNSALAFDKSDSHMHTSGIILAKSVSESSNVIESKDPRLDYIRALELLDMEIGFERNESSAQIDPTAYIGPNVFIDTGVEIGANTVIEPNVVIFKGTKIGRNCLIRANATIGGDGFGYERDNTGKPIKFVHLGGVEIGDNVEIGACACIAKGTLGNTIIENDAKIDNLVHVAHNCVIREGAFVIATSILCGGVEVGKNAWIAPNATVTQKAKVGEGSIVGLGAVVTKDVESNAIVAGNPAKLLRSTK